MEDNFLPTTAGTLVVLGQGDPYAYARLYGKLSAHVAILLWTLTQSETMQELFLAKDIASIEAVLQEGEALL